MKSLHSGRFAGAMVYPSLSGIYDTLLGDWDGRGRGPHLIPNEVGGGRGLYEKEGEGHAVRPNLPVILTHIGSNVHTLRRQSHDI